MQDVAEISQAGDKIVYSRFTQVSEFAAKSLPGVLHGAFSWAVRREVRRQLRRLKALLERDAVHGD
jgi:hypothetical protein